MYAKELFSNLSSIGLKAISAEHIMGNISRRTAPGWPDEECGGTEMMEMTAMGMGLMMTGVAVVVGGLVFEVMFLMLSRALRVPLLAASIEPAAIQ